MASKTERTVVNSTISEVSHVLAQHGVTLSTSSLEFLSQRTKGWAAGVRLATLYVGAHPRPAPPPVPDQVAMPQIEPLTEREREVLHHYSGRLSVTEATSELCISVKTVKTRFKNCQDAPQEHLPQAGGESPRRGGPPSPPARADLTAGNQPKWRAGVGGEESRR
jgi:hypothetical protein